MNEEKILRDLLQRGTELSKYFSASPTEIEAHVDDIHRLVAKCEIIDTHNLEEFRLQRIHSEKTNCLNLSQIKLYSYNTDQSKMAEEERALLERRKLYDSEIATQNQLIQKYKTRVEEVDHQLCTFQDSTNLIALATNNACLSAISEEMRCVFNELRRINANIEEKLVIAGVAKQRTMKEIRAIYANLKAGCSRKPIGAGDGVMDDVNFSTQMIRDMNAVWLATLPTVPSISGESNHTDLVTCLSISMGHFAEELIKDLAAAMGGGALSEEEAKLVGVLSAETNRYSVISNSLQTAIIDTRKFIAETVPIPDGGNIDYHVRHVLESACRTIREHLECDAVSFWIRRGGGTDSVGEVAADGVVVFKNDASIHTSIERRNREGEIFAFEQSIGETFLMTEMRTDSSHPPDICVLLDPLDAKQTYDAFAVTSLIGGGGTDGPGKFGMVFVSNSTLSFRPFAAIYCEQFFRRILSATVPLFSLQMKQISNQRPLNLIEFLVELRVKGNGLKELVQMIDQHLAILFGAIHVQLIFPIDGHSDRVVILSSRDDVEDAEEGGILEYMEISKIADFWELDELKSYMRVVSPIPGFVLDAIRSGQDVQLDGGNVHVRPQTRGRTVTHVVTWENSVSGVTLKNKNECFFNPGSVNHRQILTTYLTMFQSMISDVIGQFNSNFDKSCNLLSYQNMDRMEERTIAKFLS